MLDLTKLEFGEDSEIIYFATDDGMFSISKVDLDLYFKPDSGLGKNDRYLNKNDSYTFKITSENIAVYNIFGELYEAIKERKPYSNSIYDFEEKEYILPEYVDLKEESKLFKDGKIIWHSDECDYENSSVLIIEKGNDSYNITFNKSIPKDNAFGTFAVKVSAASGRYYHFSQTFINMYQKLDDYYSGFNQNHNKVRVYGKNTK